MSQFPHTQLVPCERTIIVKTKQLRLYQKALGMSLSSTNMFDIALKLPEAKRMPLEA